MRGMVLRSDGGLVMSCLVVSCTAANDGVQRGQGYSDVDLHFRQHDDNITPQCPMRYCHVSCAFSTLLVSSSYEWTRHETAIHFVAHPEAPLNVDSRPPSGLHVSPSKDN